MLTETLANVFMALVTSGVVTVAVTALLDRRRRKAENNKIEAETHKLNSEADKVQVDCAGQISSSALNLVEKYEQRVDSLETEVAALVEDRNRMAREICVLKSEMLNLQNSAAVKDKKVAVLEGQIQRKDSRISELEGRVTELESEVRRLQAENEALRGCGK